MRKLILTFLILFACDNKATDIKPKDTDDLIESSVFIDINDVVNPAIKTFATNITDRIYISVVEVNIDSVNTRHQVHMDALHFIGLDADNVHIDYGQNLIFEGVYFDRRKDSNTRELTFEYFYDSDINHSSFNPVFNFISKPTLTNVGEDGAGSSKKIHASSARLELEKRIKFVNIEQGQTINKDEDLQLVFNRVLLRNFTALGFVKYEADNKVNFITLSVNENGRIINVKNEFIQKFLDKVDEEHFECYIWVAETKQISTRFISEFKDLEAEYSTPIITNQVLSQKIKF